jgi:hypothetical protein
MTLLFREPDPSGLYPRFSYRSGVAPPRTQSISNHQGKLAKLDLIATTPTAVTNRHASKGKSGKLCTKNLRSTLKMGESWNAGIANSHFPDFQRPFLLRLARLTNERA